jgi:hypothetical protein
MIRRWVSSAIEDSPLVLVRSGAHAGRDALVLDVQVGPVEAADDPAEVVEVIAPVSELPALLADQVARDRVWKGDAAVQTEGDRRLRAVWREVLEDRPIWRSLSG